MSQPNDRTTDTPDLGAVRARAFDLSSDLATVVAPAGQRIVDVNDAFLRLTGYDRDEVVGQRPTDLELLVEARAIDRIVEDLRAGLAVTEVPVELRAKDGSVHPLRASAELVEADGTEYLLAMGEDASDDVEPPGRPRRWTPAFADRRRRASARVDLAIGEERARIAQDLHRTTLQDLAVATLRVYLLSEVVPATNREDVQRVREAVDTATASTRAVIAELRGPAEGTSAMTRKEPS